jgi:hypothetical protein
MLLMMMGRRGHAAVGGAAVLLLCACGGKSPDPPPPSRSAQASATPSPVAPPASGDQKSALLTVADLPGGFVDRPLTARNLPSGLTGCPPLERLVTGALGNHEQAEFFRPPLGPWIDEALLRPRGEDAAHAAGRLGAAIDGCPEVTVTEEGHRVTLRLAPATASPQDPGVTRAYRATGTLGGFALRMDVVLGHAGGSVVLLTNTALAGDMDQALTVRAMKTALDKASRS